MFFNRILLFLPLLFFSCSPPSPKEKTISPPSASQLENRNLRDSAIRLLRDGDLVFRLGNDMTSAMLSQLNQRDKSYSHCGIASVVDGKKYIFHSIGGELNPDQKLKKETPEQWFSSKNNFSISIYRLSLGNNEKLKLMETVQQFYKEGKKFDMDFDLETDDRLYCAEMIYKSLMNSSNNDTFIRTTTVFNKAYVGIDDLFLNDKVTPICRVQYK